MNGELVLVHHGKHRVQMHEAAFFGNIESQHLFECGLLAQHLGREFFYGTLTGTLGNTDGDDLFRQHQNITALKGRNLCSVVPHSCVFIKRVVGKNISAEQGFPGADVVSHAVDGNAAAHGRKGVTGEVEVGHGVGQKRVVIFQQAQQAAKALVFGFTGHGFADAGTHGLDKLFCTERGKIFRQKIHFPGGFNSGFVDKIAYELFSNFAVGNGFGGQVLKVDHLAAPAFQQGRKLVMFPSSFFQIWDIVEQQPVEMFRHQVFQLTAGSVKHNPFQRADFGIDIYTVHGFSPFMMDGQPPLPDKFADFAGKTSMGNSEQMSYLADAAHL